MTEKEIINQVRNLWVHVQNDQKFPPEITAAVAQFLEQKMLELEAIKELGTRLYREVGQSNYPDGDVRRDGIRSMSHFVMGYWDIKAGRIESSKKRLHVAQNNMKNYLHKL